MAKSRQAKSLKDTLLDIIPENPLQEMVGALDGSSKGNGILAVMFFALILGAARSRRPPCRDVHEVLEGTYAASMQIIDWAMQLAPLGVACLVFAMTARLGGEVFVTLIWFLATVLLGFAMQLGVVYPLMLVASAGVTRGHFSELSRTRCSRRLPRPARTRRYPCRSVWRNRTASAAGRRAVRAHGRRDGQSERDGAVRRRGGACSCPGVRRGPVARPAVHGRAARGPGRRGNGRRAGRFASP